VIEATGRAGFVVALSCNQAEARPDYGGKSSSKNGTGVLLNSD
jgi:hypothetical protein